MLVICCNKNIILNHHFSCNVTFLNTLQNHWYTRSEKLYPQLSSGTQKRHTIWGNEFGRCNDIQTLNKWINGWIGAI